MSMLLLHNFMFYKVCKKGPKYFFHIYIFCILFFTGVLLVFLIMHCIVLCFRVKGTIYFFLLTGFDVIVN